MNTRENETHSSDVRHKPVTTRTHGILDYALGPVLFLAPNIFGFADMEGPAVWVPRLIGALTLLQAIVTRYEVGLVKMMPMRFHLFNDYAAGAFLAASPWLFRFYDPANQSLWLPHLIAGLSILIVTALTEKAPRHWHAREHRAAHA
jgi:hypothetical protein